MKFVRRNGKLEIFNKNLALKMLLEKSDYPFAVRQHETLRMLQKLAQFYKS